MVRHAFVAALALTSATLAHADSTTPAAPEKIHIAANGTVRFRLANLTRLCGAVANGTNEWGDIAVGQGGVTAEGQRAMLQTLMAAKLAGKPVFVWASDGSATQWGCKVIAVEVQ